MIQEKTLSRTTESIDPSGVGKKARRGTPKSRNGCITCKIRRIKCDEARPSCQKCTSTGRRCDGYVIQPSARHQALVIVAAEGSGSRLMPNPLLDFTGSPRDHRILTYFYSKTAPCLAGAFDLSFWNQLIPQVAHSEPAVQHALIAVSIAHARIESLQGTFLIETEIPATDRLIIHHYNKAIQHLSRCLAANEDSYDVALLCCILFVCLEYLNNDQIKALTHVQGGFGILHSWHVRSKESGVRRPVGLASTVRLIEDQISQIFGRLRLQWSLCGRPYDYLGSYDSHLNFSMAINHEFTSIQEVRRTFDKLLDIAIKFVQITEECRNPDDPQIRASKETGQKVILDHFRKWLHRFDGFMEKHSEELDQPQINGGKVLRLICLTGQLWTLSTLSRLETRFDSLIDKFQEAVDFAETIKGPISYSNALHKESSEARPLFTFEMGVIAPLYFVARKCRHPLIRRKAISLMKTVKPRCEGIWDADYMGPLVQKVQDLEEAGVEDLIAADPESFALYIPEEKRVFDSRIMHDAIDPGLGEQAMMVQYLSKPYGPNGPVVNQTYKIFATK